MSSAIRSCSVLVVFLIILSAFSLRSILEAYNDIGNPSFPNTLQDEMVRLKLRVGKKADHLPRTAGLIFECPPQRNESAVISRLENDIAILSAGLIEKDKALQDLKHLAHDSRNPSEQYGSHLSDDFREELGFIKSAEHIQCLPSETCIGPECDFACDGSASVEIPAPHGPFGTGVRSVILDDSKGCTFWFPSNCTSCTCIDRKHYYEHEHLMAECRPCRFRKLGWFRKAQLSQFPRFSVPMYFPTSCNASIMTPTHIFEIIRQTAPEGLWIALAGDSQMRSVFVAAVKFLSSSDHWPALKFEPETVNEDRYFCANIHYFSDGSYKLQNAVMKMSIRFFHPRNKTLADIIASEIRERRRNDGNNIPVCVSSEWQPVVWGLIDAVDQYEDTYNRTGIKPVSMVFNPGLHVLNSHFDLHTAVSEVQQLKARCQDAFTRNQGAKEPGGGRHCLLLTTTATKYSRQEAVKYDHKRLYSNIKGYNAAVMSAWYSGGGTPVIDVGELSLSPAVMNSLSGDRLHYEPTSPVYLLTWQMILNTALHRGAQICET